MGCFRDHVPVKDADLMRYLGNTSNQVLFFRTVWTSVDFVFLYIVFIICFKDVYMNM